MKSSQWFVVLGVSAVLLLSAAAFRGRGGDDAGSRLRAGDRIVLVGDSITEQGYRNDWGYYHVLTNAVAQDRGLKGLGLEFVPLGFSGYQVGSWAEMERDSVTNATRWTNYRDPGWGLKGVFDGKADVIVVFLGMNDILQPSIRDTEEDLDRWITDYRRFVRNLRERCKPREFVFATITPLTGDETSPKNRVRDRLNNRLRMLADEEHALLADFGAAIGDEAAALRVLDPSYRLVPDFVHPNAVGHAMLAGCLLGTLGADCDSGALEAAERVADLALEGLAERGANTVSASLECLRVNRPDDAELVYDVNYRINDRTEASALPETRIEAPEGWSVDEPCITGMCGAFVVRGRPDRAVTTLRVVSTLGDGSSASAEVAVPAPWRVREDGGEWAVYSASPDYTGGDRTGSIDPYQTFFGWKTGRFVAARRVWSEKAREVRAVLSHQGFSETLDLAVSLDGREVWTDNLDRRGRNRLERTLRLHEGWNAVEIACVHHDWQRQFAFELEPLEGDDLSALRYDLK